MTVGDITYQLQQPSLLNIDVSPKGICSNSGVRAITSDKEKLVNCFCYFLLQVILPQLHSMPIVSHYYITKREVYGATDIIKTIQFISQLQLSIFGKFLVAANEL